MTFDTMEELREHIIKRGRPSGSSNKSITLTPDGIPELATERDSKKWTQADIDFFVDNYKKKTTKWIAYKLRRSPNSIHQMAFKMKKATKRSKPIIS